MHTGDLSVEAVVGHVPGAVLAPSLSASVPVIVIDIKAPDVAAAPSPPHALPRDFVAVVDVSGSMDSAMIHVRETLRLLADNLGPLDRLAIVTFSSASNVAMAMLPSAEARVALPAILQAMKAGGQTNISAVSASRLGPPLLIRSESQGMLTAVDVVKRSARPEKRMAVLLLLSDGSPNEGVTKEGPLQETVSAAVSALVNLPTPPMLSCTSFGFTTGHNPSLLRGLTHCGNAGVGSYYFLQRSEDIKAGVLDSLGAMSHVYLYGLRVEAQLLDSAGDATSAWECARFDGKAILPPASIHHLGFLAASQSTALVLACRPAQLTGAESKKVASMEPPEILSLRVWYSEADSSRECCHQATCAVRSTNTARTQHAQTHILRLRVAAALPDLANSRAGQREALEQLHALLLETLAGVQGLDPTPSARTMVAADETLLVALERDLGSALEKLYRNGRLSAEDQVRLIQFSAEHLNQRSASCATEIRPTYATPEQQAMHTRFASGGQADAEKKIEETAAKEKGALQTQEEGLSVEEAESRAYVDEHCACFITLETWRTSNIGLGVLVQPRTIRERYRNLMPQMEVAPDYVSTDAFNRGARMLLARGITNREAAAGEHSVVTSSIRGRINAWIPLYLNSTNWRFVSRFAPAAFSIIATQVNNQFKPVQALHVMSRLLCQSVVRFMNGQLHFSEHAIQSYCDLHRTFLAMVEEYPEIRRLADEELTGFIEKPWVRGRELTPDIGNLIQYLTVTDAVSWPSFRDAYICESFRRNARWIPQRLGRPLDPTLPDAQLLASWFDGATVSLKLMLFNVLFLSVVARPEGKTLSDVCATYDRAWGRVCRNTLQRLKAGYAEISTTTSVLSVLQRVRAADSEASVVELIRWALANEKEVPIPVELKVAPAGQQSQAVYAALLKRRTALLEAFANARAVHTRHRSLRQHLEALLPPVADADPADAVSGCGKNASYYFAAAAALSAPSSLCALTIYSARDLREVYADPIIASAPSAPLALLRKLGVTGELVTAGCGSSVRSRSLAFGVAPARVLKELLFRAGDSAVLVLSSGDAPVDTARLRAQANLPSLTLMPAEIFPAHCDYYPKALPAFAHTPPLRTIINARLLRELAKDEVVVTSAGTDGYLFKIPIGALASLVPGAEVFECD